MLIGFGRIDQLSDGPLSPVQIIILSNLMKYLSILLLSVAITFIGLRCVHNTRADSPTRPTILLTNSAPKSHPVSVVEADIYVNRAQTTMRLKCFAEDLELLQGVEALEDGFYDSEELLDATKDHAEYLAERITIRDANGNLFQPKITEIIDIEIPEEGIKAGMLMNYPMGFEIEFKYDEPPEFITIQQNMVAEGALLPSELKILLKQAGSDTPYMHMMKPGAPETFRFDWDKPILSTDASEKEWEVWFEEQREKNLGITSYSSVYSFIYITAHEVRHEILIPLATLATLMEIDRRDESFLDIDEQAAAAKKIEDFFSIGNPVLIDSVEVQPVFDRVDFYGLDLRDFAVQAEKRKISMANGRVGVIMSYSTKGAPTEVEVTWDKFNNAIKSVDTVVFAYDQIEKTQFSMFLENNTFQWIAPERKPLPAIVDVSSTVDLKSLKPSLIQLPAVAAILTGLALIFLIASYLFKLNLKIASIGAVLIVITGLGVFRFAAVDIPNPLAEKPKFDLSNEDATQVFAQLHKNMFRAFDYQDESDVYDALSKSVDGELLRQLYLDINQSLKVKEQGGAIARVNEVNLLEGQKSSSSINPDDELPEFEYACKWNLIGTIEHWGHIHERENKYDANFRIQLKDDAWKITEMQVNNEEQGVVKTSLRKF